VSEAIPCARVLIVDDDTDTVDTLVTLLEQDGHACSAAYTGAGAIRACEADAFDCMVLDHQLGEVTGLAVAERLSTSPMRPNHIVLLTGHARDDFEAALRNGLIDGHLQKPAEFSDLVQRVRNSLKPR
jgi:two-component system OmpR family response regulator